MSTFVKPELEDLFDVRNKLTSVSAKWKSIGFALRLDPNTIDSIQDKNNSDPSICLTSVVIEWLKRNYIPKTRREPTWRWLVEAVGDPAGGANMALARDIASKHKAKGILNKFLNQLQLILHKRVAV